MDFFDMNFSTLFLEKHGKEIFDNIILQAKKEKIENFSNAYIEIIFKIAYLEFFGIKNDEIKIMIKDFMNYEVNIEEIKSIHKKSIFLIQEYLKSSMRDTIDKLK